MDKKTTAARKKFSIKGFFSGFFKSKKSVIITSIILAIIVVAGISSFAGTNNSGQKYVELQSVYMSEKDVSSKNSSKNGSWQEVKISKCKIVTTGPNNSVLTVKYVDGKCGSNYGGNSVETTSDHNTSVPSGDLTKHYETLDNQPSGQRVWKPKKEDKKNHFDVNYFNNFVPKEYISNSNLTYTIKGTSKGDTTNMVISAKDCTKTKLPIGKDSGSLKPGNSYTVTVSYNDPEVTGGVNYPNTNTAQVRIDSSGKISGSDRMSVQGLVRFAVSYEKTNNKPQGCRVLKDSDRYWSKGESGTAVDGKNVYSQDYYGVTFMNAKNSCTILGGRLPSVKEVKYLVNEGATSYGDALKASDSYWTEEGMMYKKGDTKPRYKGTLGNSPADNLGSYNSQLGTMPVKRTDESDASFAERKKQYEVWLSTVQKTIAAGGDAHPTIGNDHFGTYPSIQSRFSTRLQKNNARCIQDIKPVQTSASTPEKPVPETTVPAKPVPETTTPASFDGSGGEFWAIKCISGQDVKGTPNGCLAKQTQITDGVTPVPMFKDIMAGYLMVNTYSTNGQVQYEWSYQTDAAGNYSAPKLVTNVVNDGMDNLLGQPYEGKSYRYKITWWVKGKESEKKEYVLERTVN